VKVLLYEHGREPEETEIESTLAAMQRTVDGYIEIVPLADSVVLVRGSERKAAAAVQRCRI